MVQFIDAHRAGLGVEPICTVLPIAPSTYHRHRHQRTDPMCRSARARATASPPHESEDPGRLSGRDGASAVAGPGVNDLTCLAIIGPADA